MPCATGAKMNWPNEPPALTMPVANPRRSGGTSRVVAAISTAGPAMPAPPAASTPIAKISPAVLVMNGISAVPIATSIKPTTNTRPGPIAVGDDAGHAAASSPTRTARTRMPG